MSAAVIDIRASDLLERRDELKSLDDWADDDRITPTRVILGGPGVGKSAIVRMWIDRRQKRPEPDERGERLIYHMIQQGQEPALIVQSLIEQCDHLVPDPEASTAIDRPRLLRALQRVAAGRRRLLVVLDALDETSDLVRLRELIASPLPLGVRLLCSSRPQPTANAGLGDPPAVSSLNLDLPRWSASNEATCRAFWASRKAEVEWLTQGRIDEALGFGQGNMLYAVQFWLLLSSLPSDERDREMTPPNLDAVIDRSWTRIASLPDALGQPIRDALAVLTLARDSLLLAQLAELVAWPVEDEALRANFLTCVRPILRGDAEFMLYHSALGDAIRRRVPGLERLHRAIIPRLVQWLERDHQRSRKYAERHILDHCVQTGSWAQAIELCLNRGFVERWLSGCDKVLAAKLLEMIAAETAEGERKTKLERLARIVRDYPDTWNEEIGKLWRGGQERLAVPEPRAGRLMVLATASPDHLDPLRSDEEQRKIKDAWAQRRGMIRFDFCPAARFSDLRAALSAGADLLHVGCHGVENGPLEFEVDAGSNFRPGPKNFVRLVGALGASLELIVFNTCHSAELARELSEDKRIVPLAIGMEGAIPDESAIDFVEKFYANLAVGYPVQDAFDEAREQIAEEDRDYPRLFAATSGGKNSRLFPPSRPG